MKILLGRDLHGGVVGGREKSERWRDDQSERRWWSWERRQAGSLSRRKDITLFASIVPLYAETSNPFGGFLVNHFSL